MDTIVRKCDSSVQGFTGCTGEARKNSVSCGACYGEYLRRSNARDKQKEKDLKELISLLDNYAQAKESWESKPKLKVIISGLLGKSQLEGKAHYVKEYGYYLLLKQRNSSKGVIITRDYHLSDVVSVWVLDKKGLPDHIWSSNTEFGSGSLEAKELADKLEGK